MSFLERIKELVGLSDGDYYDEYGEDEYYEDEQDSFEDTPSRSAYRSPYAEASAVRRLERESDAERARRAGSGQPQVQMHIVEPRTFAEAQAIADRFKAGTPVIMNLTVTDPDVARRLIDFASGLTYGLDGGLQKVADRVFMLTPSSVDVSDAQRRDLRERGWFNPDF